MPVNRRARREIARRQRRFNAAAAALMDASEADGRPWHIYGMTDACRDCGATATLHGQGRSGPINLHIHHDHGCPAAAGVTDWQPVRR